ncbi:MAG: tRNA (adenosine(37)-N6)-threonylcarbamoyltransferase complex transferase subunit TsaD [Chloroflexi bacterium]|nr:tRNA (adenosine(37)-N6)-threonylcarbamoyltransferase complex transferase subunit TsaD [Chloroflexota bacterium]
MTVADRPLVAAIETSCDDTSVAVVRAGREELALKSQTQIEPHAAMGGIVPEAAARIHVEAIDAVWNACLADAGVESAEIDALAVTQGPGLPGSLLVGLGFAQGLAAAVDCPLIPVNHLEGHFASPWLNNGDPPEFPLMALIVSGGHTELVYGAALGEYRVIGRTRDDAAGEAFDKVARMLGLAYPGGPAIQRAAEGRDGSPFELPRAWLPGTSDFSFSGLKTAVRRLVHDELGPVEAARIGAADNGAAGIDDADFVADVAHAFEVSVVDVLVAKTVRAAKQMRAATITLTGGVAANARLRAALDAASPVPVHVPALKHCVDNASMIAVAGTWRLERGEVATNPLEPEPGLTLA